MRGAACVGLLFAALLSGCAATPVSSEATPPGAQAPALNGEAFALEGRLQVRDGERSAAVGLEWQHAEAQDEWLLTGPLGQGLARIESGPGGAVLQASDGRRYPAASVAALMQSLVGISAPLELLPRWVTARLHPDAEVRERDAQGRPARVVDQGWTIEYTEYAGDGPAALPRRVDIHQGDTRLRLIVDAWNP